jgi:hypothetical protein
MVVSEAFAMLATSHNRTRHPHKVLPTWAASHNTQQLTKSDGVLCTVYALKARTQ